MHGSLYARIGGENPVTAAVEVFYANVLADAELNRFFRDLDMPAQVRKQVAFTSHAFDGPAPVHDGEATRRPRRS